MKYRLILMMCITLLMGCTKAHLEIFPELNNPKLSERKLSIRQMHQDIDYFFANALKLHPDIALYADQNTLKKAAVQYKNEITQPLTRTEFYRIVGKLSHHFQDGHAFLLWPYQELNQLKANNDKPFPFDVVLSKSGELVVKYTYTYSNSKIPAGSRITRINGINVTEMINHMQQYVGGETRLLREQVVAKRFAINLWSVYGLINTFSIDYTFDEQGFTLDIEPEHLWQVSNSNRQMSAYNYQKLNNSTGLLFFEHFDIDPSEFEDFIDTAFEKIKRDKISNLIIDIRTNPGGNTDTVTYLSRHLADKPFRLISQLKEKLNQHNRGLFNYRGKVGEVLTTQWNDWQTPVDETKRFVGNTYVLIGNVSYSAAIVFATTMQDNQFATLVGEKTGGFANQSAQGNLFNLPHSQLRAFIATRLLVRPNGNLERQSVIPDVMISANLDDIKQQRDPSIDYILNLEANSGSTK